MPPKNKKRGASKKTAAKKQPAITETAIRKVFRAELAKQVRKSESRSRKKHTKCGQSRSSGRKCRRRSSSNYIEVDTRPKSVLMEYLEDADVFNNGRAADFESFGFEKIGRGTYLSSPEKDKDAAFAEAIKSAGGRKKLGGRPVRGKNFTVYDDEDLKDGIRGDSVLMF